ncbi:MAG: hypothetical protein HY537_07520, partial [Deltaproteobacteria bacterium]|nr:hypothetical protein [Deltaproteobacteria bacterium]
MRLGQPDSRSSHWTIALSEQRFYFLLFAFALIHLWLSSWLAPSEDELYYWCWSRNLQWSYFDHAPLVAFLIAASTWILGDSLLAIRFFACIGGVAILWLLSTLTESKRMLGLLFFC